MGGSISDLFYPSNPDRRKRAAELANALQSLSDEFDVLEKQHHDKILSLSGQMDYVLHAFGVTTLTELDAKVRATTSGAVLENYKKTVAGLDKTDKAQSIMMTIAGVAALVGLASIAILGPIFGGIVATVVFTFTIIFAGLGLILGAILGAIERANLQQDINDLYLARLEAKFYISQYKLVVQNLDRIGDLFENYLEDQTTEEGRARLKRRLENLSDNFEADLKAATVAAAAVVLRQQDNTNRSWTEEDPNEAASIVYVTNKTNAAKSKTGGAGSTGERPVGPHYPEPLPKVDFGLGNKSDSDSIPGDFDFKIVPFRLDTEQTGEIYLRTESGEHAYLPDRAGAKLEFSTPGAALTEKHRFTFHILDNSNTPQVQLGNLARSIFLKSSGLTTTIAGESRITVSLANLSG